MLLLVHGVEQVGAHTRAHTRAHAQFDDVMAVCRCIFDYIEQHQYETVYAAAYALGRKLVHSVHCTHTR